MTGRRRAGRAVLALLAGLLGGAWVGGGLVYVFNRSKMVEGVAGVSLEAAPELDAVPADAAGFAHVRAADLWRTDAMAEYRRVVGKAGADALKALDESFAPSPSALDRVTVVMLPRPAPPVAPLPPTPPDKRGGPPNTVPLPPHPGVDVVALLAFSAPFDFVKVREANLPRAEKGAAGDAELWTDPASGTALAARGDRALVVGSAAGVRAFLAKPKTPDGPLAPALALARSGTRHLVGAVNVRAAPPDFTKWLSPEAGPLLRAEALAVGVVAGRGVKVDLRAKFPSDAAAAEAEQALRKSAEAGRKSLAEARAKMQERVAGGPGAPKPRPAGDLPEALGGLFALGAIGTLDEWLADPPIEKAGPELSAAITLDSAGGVYVGAAAVSVGLLVPAVQKVREAAGRAQDANHLKELAVAMHNYEATTGRFPAAATTNPPNRPAGRPLLSWRVELLPYLDETKLYNEFHHDEPWDSPHNRPLVARMPKAYASPRGDAPPGKTHYQVFVPAPGVTARTMFGRTVGAPLLATVDGVSNTILIAEAADPVEWTKPQDLEFDPRGPLPRLGLPGAAGFNAALGDGSVRFFSHATRPQTLKLWIQADDGEPIPPE